MSLAKVLMKVKTKVEIRIKLAMVHHLKLSKIVDIHIGLYINLLPVTSSLYSIETDYFNQTCTALTYLFFRIRCLRFSKKTHADDR